MATKANANSYTLTPKVNPAREFIEIATDFANPLDLVREAISNAYDAHAQNIHLLFDMVSEHGQDVLQITIRDDGAGMNKAELEAFFDLGNSTHQDKSKHGPAPIGEKGHGTKIYYNSEHLTVTTIKGKTRLEAALDRPFAQLHAHKQDFGMPAVHVQAKRTSLATSGTTIVIRGYNHNRTDKFSHAQVKDHILWFTKHGSVEAQFRDPSHPKAIVHLRGVDRPGATPEQIPFGHLFPEPSPPIETLLQQYPNDATDYFSRKWIESGKLEKMPHISFDMVFSVEGTQVKRKENPMVRVRGKPPLPGAYTVQERYGLWLTKDFIPIQRKNEWVTDKGSEYTRFHAFVNCQDFHLTANRSSIENTPPEIIDELGRSVEKLFEEIASTPEWEEMDTVERQVNATRVISKEQKQFERRKKIAGNRKRTKYDGVELIKPRNENGVFSLAVIVQTLEHDIFPFEIIDYDTQEGIDVLAKSRSRARTGQSSWYYVEFKHQLKKDFNHSFVNIRSIVCWATGNIYDGDYITDIADSERRLQITPSAKKDGYTQYWLVGNKDSESIEVFVLETYLKEKLGIKF